MKVASRLFDPTIFDNLKVVLEGALYDADREGRLEVAGREDMIELAGMSRTFRIKLRLDGGTCIAGVSLQSGLSDFAAELRGLRLADDHPGAQLSVWIDILGNQVRYSPESHQELARIWRDAAQVRCEQWSVVHPETGEPDGESRCRISLSFQHKLDESHVEDLYDIADQLEVTLRWAESNKKSSH